MLFNHIDPSFDVPVSSVDLWRNWWNNYGLITLVIAAIGLILIVIGLNLFKKSKRSRIILKEIPQVH